MKVGGDGLTLQCILGHTSLRMVNHYVHLAHSDVEPGIGGTHRSTGCSCRGRLIG